MIELTKKEYDEFIKQGEQLRVIKNFIKKSTTIFDLQHLVEAMEEEKTNE